MRNLSASDVLEICERYSGASVTSGAIALLSAAQPETPEEELRRLEIGRRDQLLLRLRERTLGAPLRSRERCPGCGADLEFEIRASQLEIEEISAAPPPPLELGGTDLRIRFRLPSSDDLLAVEELGTDLREGRRQLAARCVLEATRAGRPVEAKEITDEELLSLAEAMAAADPRADLRLDLRCEECGHSWQTMLDVASFFLEELGIVRRCLLDEVHALARGYGWTETDILAMSARRRQAYLERLAP